MPTQNLRRNKQRKNLAISRELWYVLWLPKTKELNHT